MKMKSVHDLFLVKEIVSQYPEAPTAIGIINDVLFREVGADGILYPYNNLKDTILELSEQGMSARDIAAKVGLGSFGEETVLPLLVEWEEKHVQM